jgi:DNA adenine methylase
VALKQLTAPFPYFGGKRRAAELIWSRIGSDVTNYVEPFCGSCAVLLARPGGAGKVETVNDIDGLLVNFWRAVKHDPETVAEYASWPVTELDLLARHDWLIGKRESIAEGLRVDPDWFDAKAAGWWCWGANLWLGSGWGHACGASKLPILGSATGVVSNANTSDWLRRLSARVQGVRSVCGSWKRVLCSSATTFHGVTGVVFDPPYDAEGHDRSMYVAYGSVAKDVAEWCRENGGNPLFRIALCGYEGEHDLPGWACKPWQSSPTTGIRGQKGQENTRRERIWFSPHCLSAGLFDSGDW